MQTQNLKVYIVRNVSLIDGHVNTTIVFSDKAVAESEVARLNGYSNGSHYFIDGPHEVWKK